MPRVEQKSAATLVVELVQGSGAKLLQDQYGEPFILLPATFISSPQKGSDAMTLETLILTQKGFHHNSRDTEHRYSRIASLASLASYPLSLKSDDLIAAIAKKFYEVYNTAVGRDAIRSALQVLKGLALNAERVMLWNRVGVAADGSWWLDIGDGRSVWMDGDGWTVTDQSQVYFNHYSHQLPLRDPVVGMGGSDLFSLLDFVNLPDVDSQLLFVTWAACCLVPEIPHPVLYLYGGKGTFKSTAQAVVKEVLDRSSVGLLKLHDDLNQLNQNLDHHWIAFFDNLGKLDEAQSDVLCRAVTGAGWSKRALYTDDSDVTRWFRRCIGVNGINIVTDKPDFTDRAIILETKPVPSSMRRTDRDIQSKIDGFAGSILSDILTVVCQARKIIDGGFKFEMMPRMADYALWGAAISEVLGISKEFFLNAYRQNVRDTEETIARGNVVGGLLIDYLENLFIQKPEHEFTAHELYSILREKASFAMYNLKTDFPGDPRWLTNKIRELAPILPAVGISVRFKRSSAERKMVFNRFVPTKLDELNDYPVKSNSWGVNDLRELRENIVKLRKESSIEEIKTEQPTKNSTRVSLKFAHDSLLQHENFRRGERLELEKAQEFLVKLGLKVTEAVKLISGMLRSGELISSSPGWLSRGGV